MTDTHYDLIVIGRGPVGLSMATSAAQLGLNVAIIERHRDLYALPRAGHMDHEIVRLLQSFGVVDDMMADSYPTTDYTWVNAKGETLMEFDWGEKSVSGYNSDYMQFQPVFETALIAKLDTYPNVTQLLGWEMMTLNQDADGVTLTVAKTEVVNNIPVPTDITQVIKGKYVAASDGAASKTRTMLEIDREDFGFNEKWLVIDALKKRPVELDFDCGQICDPARPITILPLGKRHRRFEWAVLPGEDPQSLMTDEAGWKLLGDLGLGPDDLHIVRHLIYTFEAREAKEWRQGRVFLMGDAAHTMPPFMGQGMCSGMRDARNLAWKLDLVLRGVSNGTLLDTYHNERAAHSRDWTMISLEAGKVPCTMDPVEAEIRDQKFRDGWMPPMPDFPKLRSGVLDDRDGRLSTLAGTLGLQGVITKDGKTALADDFFGSNGFSLVTSGFNGLAHLTKADQKILKAAGVQLISIGNHVGADGVDAEGTYNSFFESHGIAAMLVRPDFYIFGTCASPDEISALVGSLGTKLSIKVAEHA